MKTRTCKDCQKIYPLRKFAGAGTINGKRYYRHRCIQCYSRFKGLRRKGLSVWVRNLKRGCSCEHCGINDFRVLEFHHRDRDSKSFNIADAARCGFSVDTIRSELEKCEVLCANCHRIQTWNESQGNKI